MADLYGLLVRMSLGDENAPALATRHAIAALSYQHLEEQDTAFAHHTQALSALQVAIGCIGSGNMQRAFQTMAASMLLNLFETLNSEGSSLNWAIFFCGCKRIINMVHKPHRTYEGDPALILDWIFYHDTLYKFSIRHWDQREHEQIALAAQEKIVSKAIFSPMRQIILPTTGCSLELLDLVCQIVDLVHDRDDPRHLSPSHLSAIRALELRLDGLTQTPRVAAASPPSHANTAIEIDMARYTDGTTNACHELCYIAELYRLAAYIYLLRMAQGLPRGDAKVVPLVDRALLLMRRMGVCGCAWPMFIIALEARGEEERRFVAEVLAASLVKRPQGNVRGVKRMIFEAWVQQDLGGEGDLLGVYNKVVSGNRVPPSFA
ncbi:fungal-specific transcription factor domain-containing protein [Lasiosphaeria hispida]|uniref:Fungal-specific transcription factor domain-containing protein n=1 Tax=Lasiosphaeria hispida TaxID=260671 RepID=A0AAJ0HG72_9PEZI|nr:fungal-specific transcription factor domain-containing protein [Lasiosphaeria hispida]